MQTHLTTRPLIFPIARPLSMWADLTEPPAENGYTTVEVQRTLHPRSDYREATFTLEFSLGAGADLLALNDRDLGRWLRTALTTEPRPL